MDSDTRDSPEEGNNLSPRVKRLKVQHQTYSTTTGTDSPPLPTTSMSPILETMQLEHVPPTHSVHVSVFRDVENADFLHQQLLTRDSEFEYAMIDASMIASRLQLLSAVFKAITLQTSGTMKTPNVHSEIVFCLNPANNIMEAYRRYGITHASRNLVIVKVLVKPEPESETTAFPDKPALTAQDIEKHLLTHVQGNPVPLTDETLSKFADWDRILKYYKLNYKLNGMRYSNWLERQKDPAAANREINMLITSAMALKGV
ncbi:kinase binding protein CGI-121-domain-containing protein [Xylaria sp. CBS 124048]|nr:kinase binding protein CGI-121-domain-containing protein [Xylaria sp. CBS 124048]